MILDIYSVQNTKQLATLKAVSTSVVDFGSDLEATVKNMVETMLLPSIKSEGPRGVGLAAPQIGINQNFFVMMSPAQLERECFDGQYETLAICNPRFTTLGKEMEPGIEGCLSIPNMMAEVNRHLDAVLSYQDVKGQTHELILKGFAARVAQHEFDHLSGVLILDKALRLFRPRV